MNLLMLFLLALLLCLIATWLGVVWWLYRDDAIGPRAAVADEMRRITLELRK